MKKLLVLCLSLAMLLTMAAVPAGAEDGVIEINFPTYRVGTNVLAESEKILIDSFNEHYAGKYKIVVEELPSDMSYIEKMTILAATGDLPDIIEGKGGIVSLAIKNGQAHDLGALLESDPEYKAELGQATIDSQLINGKVYSIPDLNQCFAYFYNKEMFEKAGIKPAETWEEWMDNCRKLKDAGVTPLTFFTGENSWTTQNVLVSIIGTVGEAGNALVNSPVKVKEWNAPEVIEGLRLIETMFKEYCMPDAVGGIYANAANYFLQEKAAIMPNGAWMIPDFSDPEKAPEGFADKVGVALFPQGGMISNYDYGFAITTKDPAKEEACWAAVKWLTNANAQKVLLETGGNIPTGPKVEISAEYREKNPLVAQLVDLIPQAQWKYKTMNKLAYENLTYDGFSTLYPELIYDKITPEEMVVEMTNISMKNE